MNIALCFSGQVRDFSVTLRGLRKHILSPLRSHRLYLFCHTPAIGQSPHEFGLFFSAIHREGAEPSSFSFLQDHSIRHDVEDRPWNQCDPLIGYVRQLRSIYLAHKLQQDFAQANNITFDLVFRLRFDNLYVQSLESLSDLEPAALYVPAHDSWGGLNDRFAFGSPDVMDVYCNRFEYFQAYYEEGVFLHPETLLAHHLARYFVPVRRTRVVHHLYRHGTLNKAIFKLEEGDDPRFTPPQPGMRWRFQIKKRFGDKFYDNLSYLWWRYGL